MAGFTGTCLLTLQHYWDGSGYCLVLQDLLGPIIWQHVLDAYKRAYIAYVPCISCVTDFGSEVSATCTCHAPQGTDCTIALLLKHLTGSFLC